MIGFCTHHSFLAHETGAYHPERADRLRAIYKALYQAGLLEVDLAPELEMDFGITKRAQRPLEMIEPCLMDEAWLTMVHRSDYIRQVRRVCETGGVLDRGDTIVCPASYQAAMMACSAALSCVDAVMQDRVASAFAAVRPPGHHAESNRAMGFCLFANIAVAARYAQAAYGLERVAIVDFDVHHGNGTQHAFEPDPSVLFVSLHQDPRNCWPASGYEWETGSGTGRGYTLNLPLTCGCDDADYMKLIDSRVVPELEEFSPQLLLLSAGFDAHRDDPLADLNLTETGYELLTRSLAAVADRHSQGRIVSILEGGYDLRALGRSVVAHLRGLGAS